MDLATVSNAIAVCEKHLNDNKAFNTEIESYLVKYLLALICGEYEEAIEEMVAKRADKAGDPELSSYVRTTTDKITFFIQR